MDRFIFTENHLRLIRNMVVSWDITEIGAPAIHPQIPYGSPNLFRDIQRISGMTKRGAIRKLHRETEDALRFYLKHAILSPGDYNYPNMLRDIEDDLTIDILSAENTEKPDIISFCFTDQHLKLLRYASVRWNEWDEEEGDEYYPAPGIDPKRPYGAMTYYYADMANALDMKYETDQDGHAVFAPEQEEMFHKLHEDMQCALQVFLLYAQIPPELFPDKKQISRQLEGKIFVLTGTLETMTRNEAKALIEKAGGKVTDSVSKKTNYVVVGESPGSKLDKARKLGIAIIDENALKELTD